MTATVTLHRSLLVLDAEHPAVRAAIVDAHHMHALVMSGFADRLHDYDFFTGHNTGHADHRASLNIQHATSLRNDGTNSIRVLVQSSVEAQWENPEADKWRDALLVDHADPTPRIHTPILDGKIRYELRANPTRNKNGRKLALTTHTDITNWWFRKAAAAGLHLDSTPEIDSPWEMKSRTKTERTQTKSENAASSGGKFTIRTHRLTGYATVTDPDVHLAALTTGIGAARAYGCGMLLTMRPKTRN